MRLLESVHAASQQRVHHGMSQSATQRFSAKLCTVLAFEIGYGQSIMLTNSCFGQTAAKQVRQHLRTPPEFTRLVQEHLLHPMSLIRNAWAVHACMRGAQGRALSCKDPLPSSSAPSANAGKRTAPAAADTKPARSGPCDIDFGGFTCTGV